MPAPYSTLEKIYIKVRRLTRSPSDAQLSNNDINDYVNQFVLYDLPAHLRLFELRTVLTFYTTPLVSDYATTTTDPDDPLYNFKNRYITIHQPIYINGFKRFFTQSRDQFYGIFPQVQSIVAYPTLGDGVQLQYNGTLTTTPIIKGQFEVNSVNALGAGLNKVDVPYPPGNALYPTYGAMVTPNTAPPVALDPNNYINYLTNTWAVQFPSAPAAQEEIWIKSVPNAAGIPQAMLYYDDIFTLRPIPDQVYKIEMEVYKRPSELLSTNLNQEPELEQWAQFIAYGAARKVFQDRLDMESLQLIEPEYKQQELLVLRRTIVQLTNQRTSTIFTEGNANYPYFGWGFFGSSNS